MDEECGKTKWLLVVVFSLLMDKMVAGGSLT